MGLEKTTQQGALYSALLTKYNAADQIKKTKRGRTCSAYGVQERCVQGFSGNS